MSEGDRPRFRRPWEDESEATTADPDPEPGGADGTGDAEPSDGTDDLDMTEVMDIESSNPGGPTVGASEDNAPDTPDESGDDWSAMADSPTSIDHFSEDAYRSATTQEYETLAREVRELRDAEFEHQPNSATMAGVDSGLVGFEDVTGRRGVTEEDVEAAEQARSSDLAVRIGSAVVLVGVFLGSVILGGWWFTGFLTAMMAISLGEFYATVRRVGFRPLALTGLLGVLAMPILVHRSGVFAIAGVMVTVIVLTVLAFSLVPRRHPFENTSITVFGMAWVALLAFAVPIAQSPNPAAMVLLVAFTTAMVDIGSYAVGRGFGSRPLAPQLSPNKTVEGFVGGLVMGILTAAVISTFPPYAELGFNSSILIGLLISLVAPLGDLAESMIKRSLGVKDMGSILPGHGGMLDRIDGFLFAVPVTYVVLLIRGFV